MNTRPLDVRRSGVLLHISSLASRYGLGDLGHEAYRFVDFLQAAGCSVWQVLPLVPPSRDLSPYNAISVHAGNPAFISIDWLRDRNWVDDKWAEQLVDGTLDRQQVLELAAERFYASLHTQPDWALALNEFCDEHVWLDDFADFVSIREREGYRPWTDWPQPLRDREPQAIAEARSTCATRIAGIRFEQFVFFKQWQELKAYAAARNVLFFGDIPIFVAHDSADVWSQRDQFRLDEEGRPTVVTGVPPDYFAEHGQRWGNPHYNWSLMAADDFSWWRARMRSQRGLFDLIRIDHFRGFAACWEIPAIEPTAIGGRWIPGPGDRLLDAIGQEVGEGVLIAEDLGIITEDVTALRLRHEMPGMLVLQFAFDGDSGNLYLPHNHTSLNVCYTGTHDNDTTAGWFDGLGDDQKASVYEYLNRSSEPMPWALIRAALASVSVLAVVPVQDLLGLGSEDRMNIPGVPDGNWRWQMAADALSDALAADLRGLNEMYGRLTNRG